LEDLIESNYNQSPLAFLAEVMGAKALRRNTVVATRGKLKNMLNFVMVVSGQKT
jgi:hypothetical protein